MRVKLSLPAPLVFLPQNVGALISGRDSGRTFPRQVATVSPLPDILGRQVKKGSYSERGPLTVQRGARPAGRWSSGLAQGLLETVG
jgi:hypothetical protein